MRQPKEPETGAEYYYNWLIPNIGTVDRVDASFAGLGPTVSQDHATIRTSAIFDPILDNHKTLKTYVDQFEILDDPAYAEPGEFIDLPDDAFLQNIKNFQEKAFKDKSGMIALTVLVNAGVDEKDKDLYYAYVEAFTAMNMAIGQEGSNEDYSTKFNIMYDDVNVADVLANIKALGGISLNPTGPYQIDAVRDAAIALLSNENNKLLAKDVYTQAAAITQLLGLVNNIEKAGFQARLTETVSSKSSATIHLDSAYLFSQGCLLGGAFKPQEMQQAQAQEPTK